MAYYIGISVEFNLALNNFLFFWKSQPRFLVTYLLDRGAILYSSTAVCSMPYALALSGRRSWKRFVALSKLDDLGHKPCCGTSQLVR